jgi:hypothetical protein
MWLFRLFSLVLKRWLFRLLFSGGLKTWLLRLFSVAEGWLFSLLFSGVEDVAVQAALQWG